MRSNKMRALIGAIVITTTLFVGGATSVSAQSDGTYNNCSVQVIDNAARITCYDNEDNIVFEQDLNGNNGGGNGGVEVNSCPVLDVNGNQLYDADGNPAMQACEGSGDPGSGFPVKDCADNPDYCTPPQPQIAHPSMYLETGVPDVIDPSNANTKNWQFELERDMVAIIGGFEVDNRSQGVLKALRGPRLVDTTVTDGFISVIISEWGNSEFCFRLGQAIQNDWAHDFVRPLRDWEPCAGYNGTYAREDDGDGDGQGARNNRNNGGQQDNGARRDSGNGECSGVNTGPGNTRTFSGGCEAVGFRVWINGRLQGNAANNSSQCWTDTPVGSTVKITDGRYGGLSSQDKAAAADGRC